MCACGEVKRRVLVLVLVLMLRASLTCSVWLGVSAERGGVFEDVITAACQPPLLLSSGRMFEADPGGGGDKSPSYCRCYKKMGKCC